MRLKKLPVELRDRIVSRHRSGEGNQNISAALMVPKNTVAAIILNWFATTETLPRAVRRAKLSNRGRRALVRWSRTWWLLWQSSRVPLWSENRANLSEGQPSLQHSNNQAIMGEWPDRSHSSVKGTWQPAWSLPKGTERTLTMRNQILWSDGTKI